MHNDKARAADQVQRQIPHTSLIYMHDVETYYVRKKTIVYGRNGIETGVEINNIEDVGWVMLILYWLEVNLCHSVDNSITVGQREIGCGPLTNYKPGTWSSR